MSRTRMLIIAFWIFIVVMLLWQFYTYNQGLKQSAIDHPTQTQFWFTNSPANAAVAPAGPTRNGADVEQTGFTVEDNAPARGSFTCHVTLKNVGNAKAVGVQVSVRPFRGASNFDEDAGHQKVIVLDDNDPISLTSQWVAFPDLAPGESSTQTAIFLSRSFTPGKNPKPEILFETEKVPPTSLPPKPSSRGNGGE